MTSGPGAEQFETFPAERAKAFIDAVVAIAITLLVLPLMESASEVSADDAELGDWFSEHLGQAMTFVISFTVIAVFWLGHHRVFTYVKHLTGTLLWLSMLWLLTVVWMPVVTALTGQAAAGDRTVLAVYIGSMLSTSVVWLATREYVARQPALHVIPSSELRRGLADSAATSILLGVALVLALSLPHVGYYSLFVLLLSPLVQRAVAPAIGRLTIRDGTAGAA